MTVLHMSRNLHFPITQATVLHSSINYEAARLKYVCGSALRYHTISPSELVLLLERALCLLVLCHTDLILPAFDGFSIVLFSIVTVVDLLTLTRTTNKQAGLSLRLNSYSQISGILRFR